MLSNISFCAKPPIIHDYYPIEEALLKAADSSKKKAEAYTRFDGINIEAKAKKAVLKQEPPAAGSNVHLNPEPGKSASKKDLPPAGSNVHLGPEVEAQAAQEAQAAIDSINAAAAGDAYEQFKSF